MFSDEQIYLHGLNLFPNFGPARLKLLADNFKNFKEAYLASETKLVQAGINAQIAGKFFEFKKNVDLESEAKDLEKEKINILNFKDAAYPKLLLEIPKLPPILYYKGIMADNDELCIAVVGTRQITTYGRTVIPSLVEPLVNAGAIIVSGMAFGVDSAAHEIAVKKGCRTIAVLGGGLDENSLYPKHHALLAKQIIDTGGALLSEYPIGTPNFKQNFIARNRIIAGLSVATLIVECDLESGTLITANHALDQNRQVFAVPGPIYSQQSQGPNNLIKLGAKAVTSADDIFQDLNLEKQAEAKVAQEILEESQEEAELLKLINFEPLLINDIIRKSGMPAAAVTSTLTFLEMKGKVKNLGGQQYILTKTV